MKIERSSFFNSRGGDRKYKAEVFAEYFASFIGNGVFPNPAENLMVQAGTDMTVTLKAGKAWINGYYYHNTNDLTVKIDTADGILSRIDRIVVRLDLIERTVLRYTKKGVPSENPVPPELQRDADIYELALADISVYNGSVTIVQADITDLRLSELCGLVTQTVESVDTTQLFAQLTSYTELFKATAINDFMSWFESIKDILDENVAAHLMNIMTERLEEVDGQIMSQTNFSELDDIEIQAGSAMVSSWTTIKFPVPFTGIPRVTANAADGNTDSIVSIANVTAASFQAYVTQFSPTTRYAATSSGGAADTAIDVLAMQAVNRTINWTAIYDGRNI